jgi:putative membrane protein insertion efficiency factor
LRLGSRCHGCTDSLPANQQMMSRTPVSWPSSCVCRLIRLYQRVAPPAVRKACRFQPTCSEYAFQVFRRDGIVQGLPRVVSRLWRCRPPNGGTDRP